MIKKIIITFAVLFCIHLSFVMLYPGIGKATNQWQENVVYAQTYLYSKHVDTVIVGTSLAARIIGDSVPSVKSLAFQGCSVEDGLRIVLARKQKPQFVLVETNYFFKDGNPQLFSGQTNYCLYELKKKIPSLREQYQPICLLNSVLNDYNERHNDKKMIKEVDYSLLDREIKRRLKAGDDTLDTRMCTSRLIILKELMSELEKQGVKFVFFEMPINEKLRDTKGNVQTRQIVLSEFPQSKYLYLPSDTAKYLTTDGIHLGDRDAQTYSHYFKCLLSQTELR